MDGRELLNALNLKWQERFPGLVQLQFSDWFLWKQRLKIAHLNHRGVYIIAKYDNNEIPQSVDPLDKHIICVGRTKGISRNLKVRLNEFDGAAFGTGAPHAVGYTYKEFFGTDQEGLYLSVCPVFWMDKITDNDLEEFGIQRVITWLEVCLRGVYVYKWGRLPKLNKE